MTDKTGNQTESNDGYAHTGKHGKPAVGVGTGGIAESVHSCAVLMPVRFE